ncbi:MAG: hypothetical protein H0W50_02835 [Parachlamydiaceae bacterium]|nr:hypothetical protein [Parachlamydiaceae bacterium]
MSDNNFFIRDTPRNDGAYNDGDAKKTRPLNTNASRNFKNVLDKDDDSKGSSNIISKKPSTSDEDEGTALSAVDEDEVSDQSTFSLFTQRKTKVKLSKEAPPPPEDELIAEAEGQAARVAKTPKATEIAYIKKTDIPEKAYISKKAEIPEEAVTAEDAVISENVSENAETPEGALISKNAEIPEEAEIAEAQPEQKVNVDVAAREIPKNIEKKMPEVAVAQQTVVPVPEKKELPSLYGPGRSNRAAASASKEKKDVDSPAALFTKQNKDIGHKVDEDSGKSGLADFGDEIGVVAADNAVGQKKENVVNPFAREKQDISAVNPQGMIQPVSAMELVGNVAEAPKPIPASATLRALIEQLVKEITVMIKSDKSETTLTLSQPPLFAGAQVTMTGFDSARGEVNITFANLTQNAQMVVQQQQQNLLAGLEAKGYHVHIFTATTVANEPVIAKAEINQSNKDQRGRGEGEGGEGEQQRRNPQR